jgi:hypothetical protein
MLNQAARLAHGQAWLSAPYERGNRALKVETAAELAWLSCLPLGDLFEHRGG